MKTIIFLGRNTQNILKETQDAFTDLGEFVIISRDGDNLPLPEGLAATPVSEFEADPSALYRVIFNGGTTAQQVPTLKKLVDSGAAFEGYDLQRDGVQRLW